jgi:hypothetical protein
MESASVGYLGPAEGFAEGSAAPAPAGAQAAQRPDSTNTLLITRNLVEVVGERSRSVLDPVGGARQRAAYRSALCAFAASIPDKRAVMVTLTVDRTKFDGPEQAHAVMMLKLARLMRKILGDGGAWMRVLEFQSKTGDGWPHVHLVAAMPQGVTLRTVRHACWHWWRDRWSIGGCDVQPVRSGKACALYLGKYFTKAVQAIPPWQLERERASRIYGASRATQAFRPCRRRYRCRSSEPTRRPRRTPLPSTVLHRLAQSGTTSRLRRLLIDPATGEIRYRWLPRRLYAPLSAMLTRPGVSPAGPRALAFELAADVPLETAAAMLEADHAAAVEVEYHSNRYSIESAWPNAHPPDPPT